MTNAAIEARRQYQREWRAKRRDHLRTYHKRYREENKEKIIQHQMDYWERRAQETN